MPERREPVGIASRSIGIERRHVGHEDEEVGARCPRPGAGHGDCARNITDAGLAGRLVGDWREQLAGIGRDAALDQAAVSAVGDRHVHCTVEVLAIEAVRVDVTEEVGRGDRRPAPVECDDDPTEIRVDRYRHQVFLGSLRLDGVGRDCLRDSWSGEGRKQRGSEDSVLHRPTHSKGLMNIATQAFPLRSNPL